MYFVVTIDTEEDQWSDYSRNDQTLNNIFCIPRLQQLFTKYQVRPTYLLTYPVVENIEGAAYFQKLVEQDSAEVGAHCHPWNTPPFEEKLCVRNSMLCNLPSALQQRKLEELTSFIEKKIGSRPVSFRAGRWGYGVDVAKSLAAIGYQVETSLTPFMNWQQYQGPDLTASSLHPYFFSPDKPMVAVSQGSLLEVPVSIGFNRSNFSLCHWYSEVMGPNPVLKKLFLGSLSRLGLLRKIWLSPEISTAPEMISLMEMLSKKGVVCWNMMFHSNSLVPGNTPFVSSKDELDEFYNRIEQVLKFVTASQCNNCVTLSELYNELSKQYDQMV